MRKILLILISCILTLCNTNALADKILAIIDNTPITHSEVQNLRKVISYFGGLDAVKSQKEEVISKMMLDAAISDQIIINYAKSVSMKASDQEVDAMIKAMAESKKLSSKDLINYIKNNLSVPEKEFKNKIKVEVLRTKIVREVLSRNIDVSQKDVQSLALSTHFKDATLDLKILTAKDNGEKTYHKMQKLKAKIKNCDYVKRLNYKKFAELSEIKTRLSSLSPTMQTLTKDLPINTPSDVIEDEGLRIVLVCAREIDEITSQDNYNLTNFLGNKKLQIDTQKFFQDLRKKAYVKIVE